MAKRFNVNDAALGFLRGGYCCSLQRIRVLFEQFICHVIDFALCSCRLRRVLNAE